MAAVTSCIQSVWNNHPMKFSWRILIFKVSRSGKAGGAESESLGRVKSLNGSIATWLGFSVFLLKISLMGSFQRKILLRWRCRQRGGACQSNVPCLTDLENNVQPILNTLLTHILMIIMMKVTSRSKFILELDQSVWVFFLLNKFVTKNFKMMVAPIRVHILH